jgi:hypothetical protein
MAWGHGAFVRRLRHLGVMAPGLVPAQADPGWPAAESLLLRRRVGVPQQPTPRLGLSLSLPIYYIMLIYPRVRVYVCRAVGRGAAAHCRWRLLGVRRAECARSEHSLSIVCEQERLITGRIKSEDSLTGGGGGRTHRQTHGNRPLSHAYKSTEIEGIGGSLQPASDSC